MKITLRVNGDGHEPDIHPGETLLELLRRLGYAGVKDGCANGDCGSCAVLFDGRAVAACLLFAAQAADVDVTTVEGLATEEGMHPLQQTMLDTGGVQCGFCTPGMLMTAIELLEGNPELSDHEIRVALAGNLCRCTGYVKQVDAIQAAAALMRGDGDG